MSKRDFILHSLWRLPASNMKNGETQECFSEDSTMFIEELNVWYRILRCVPVRRNFVKNCRCSWQGCNKFCWPLSYKVLVKIWIKFSLSNAEGSVQNPSKSYQWWLYACDLWWLWPWLFTSWHDDCMCPEVIQCEWPQEGPLVTSDNSVILLYKETWCWAFTVDVGRWRSAEALFEGLGQAVCLCWNRYRMELTKDARQTRRCQVNNNPKDIIGWWD